MVPRTVANAFEVGDDSLERPVLTEEDAQLERVLVDRRDHLLEPVAQPLEPELGDLVERLVRPLGLADETRCREPVLDELAKHGVELRLRRRPEEPDASLGIAQQVVAGPLTVSEEAEYGDFRGRHRRSVRPRLSPERHSSLRTMPVQRQPRKLALTIRVRPRRGF